MKFLLSSLSEVYCFTEDVFPSQERKPGHYFRSPSIGIPPSSHSSTSFLLSSPARRLKLSFTPGITPDRYDVIRLSKWSEDHQNLPGLVSPNVSHRVLTLLRLKNTDDVCETSIPLMARFIAGRADECRTLLRHVMRSFVLVMDGQSSFTYRRSHTGKC